jgi:hypothetical protein
MKQTGINILRWIFFLPAAIISAIIISALSNFMLSIFFVESIANIASTLTGSIIYLSVGVQFAPSMGKKIAKLFLTSSLFFIGINTFFKWLEIIEAKGGACAIVMILISILFFILPAEALDNDN